PSRRRRCGEAAAGPAMLRARQMSAGTLAMHRRHHGRSRLRSLPQTLVASPLIQRLRVPIGFALAIPVLFYFPTPSGLSILLGLPVAVAGLVFRGMAAGVIRKNSRLATSGPYAWTRNPLYFGTFLLVVGFAIMCASVYGALILLIGFGLIYPRVIRKEEAELDAIFGEEFRRYCSKVPRFFPRLDGFQPSFSSAQYMANREYNAALGLLAATGILILRFLNKL